MRERALEQLYGGIHCVVPTLLGPAVSIRVCGNSGTIYLGAYSVCACILGADNLGTYNFEQRVRTLGNNSSAGLQCGGLQSVGIQFGACSFEPPVNELGNNLSGDNVGAHSLAADNMGAYKLEPPVKELGNYFSGFLRFW